MPQGGGIFLSIPVHNLPSQLDVPVEPRMPQPPSVRHHVELAKALESAFGNGSNFEAWAIRMGSDDLEGGFGGLKLLSNVKGDDGGGVAGEEVLFAFLEVPIGGLGKFDKAVVGEDALGLAGDVEGGLAVVGEVEEVVGEEAAPPEELGGHVLN